VSAQAGGSVADTRVDLARAVAAGPDGRIVPADNKRLGRWVGIEDAVGQDLCFAVYVRGDILALDCDGPDGVEPLWQIYEHLVDVGVQPVVLASGQPGRLHLFAWVPHDRFRQWLVDTSAKPGLDVRTGRWMRPPLTVHRRGYKVSLLRPETADEALTALTTVPDDLEARIPAGSLGDGPVVDATMPSPWPDTSPPGELSHWAGSLLRRGDTAGRYPSRSEMVQAITFDAARAGLEFEDLFGALMDPSAVGGDRLREEVAKRGEDRARRWLRGGWDKASPLVATGGKRSLADRVKCWRSAVSRTFTGAGAASDLLVMDALLARVAKVGSFEINASQRELADEVGITKVTVANSLRRLAERGLLTTTGKSRLANQAITYRLNATALDALAETRFNPPHSHPHMSEQGGPDLDVDHDLFRNNRGLGKGTGLTWRVLGSDPQSVAELATRRGIRPGTVRNHLKRLGDFHLAEQTPQGWVQVPVSLEEMDHLAVEIGTLGSGARQKHSHDAERQRFKATYAGDINGDGWERYRALRNKVPSKKERRLNPPRSRK
jgi:DNA-binding MarR family transcriptional regulator